MENRIVIKVGTSTLTHATGRLNIRRTEELVKVLSDIKNSGKELILVSSGAIAVGAGKLSMYSRPADLPGKQACAAVGQCELMHIYDQLFARYNHIVAQVLLTRDAVEDAGRRMHAENTFERLLSLGIIPIVNENDTVSVDEINFGDNDALSATVAQLVHADQLVILSDIEGLYDMDPKEHPEARLISRVERITPEILRLAGGKGSEFGTGGMITKLHAAQTAFASGFTMRILSGSDPNILYDCMEGKPVGTLFAPKEV